jgi:heterotetrameric sarcosine oxidase delta subunit
MLRIRCPHCGLRDEAEFRYRGDATVARPAPDAGEAAFRAYVYERANPNGLHLEYWHHVHGCRRVLKMRRHTLTHAILWTGWAHEPAPDKEASAS